MQVWPAIDLRGGRCVRLQQGDYDRETVFADDSVAMARHWFEQGASCLHVVDLDGARHGQLSNRDAIAGIVSAFNGTCQLGGGVRDEATIAALLAMGLDRLVIGTRALKEPDWFRPPTPTLRLGCHGQLWYLLRHLERQLGSKDGQDQDVWQRR